MRWLDKNFAKLSYFFKMYNRNDSKFFNNSLDLQKHGAIWLALYLLFFLQKKKKKVDFPRHPTMGWLEKCLILKALDSQDEKRKIE